MLVVFDAVGTLIRPLRSVSESYWIFGASHGSSKTIQQIKSRFGLEFNSRFRNGTPTSESKEKEAWRDLVGAIFDDLAEADALFDDLWNYFADPKSWTPFPDAVVALHSFPSTMQIAIASNFDGRLHRILNEMTDFKFHGKVYVSSEIGYPKPRFEFFRSIMDDNRQVEKFVMVGDDPVCDMETPTELGWQTVLIDRNQETPSPGSIQSLTDIDWKSFD